MINEDDYQSKVFSSGLIKSKVHAVSVHRAKDVEIKIHRHETNKTLVITNLPFHIMVEMLLTSLLASGSDRGSWSVGYADEIAVQRCRFDTGGTRNSLSFYLKHDVATDISLRGLNE